MAQDDKLRVLYDALNNQYNLGSFDEFKTKMQDETKRKAFYDGVSNAYDLGSFDEFNGKIASSFVKPKPTAQPTAPKQSAVATIGGTTAKGVQKPQQEQPKWTPTPVQRMGIQMQMDDIQRKAKQSVDGFNETMKNMQSVNPLTMQSKPRVQFNASTGKMETTYGSLDGKSYTDPKTAQQASKQHQAEWLDNWENTTEEGRQHKAKRIEEEQAAEEERMLSELSSYVGQAEKSVSAGIKTEAMRLARERNPKLAELLDKYSDPEALRLLNVDADRIAGQMRSVKGNPQFNGAEKGYGSTLVDAMPKEYVGGVMQKAEDMLRKANPNATSAELDQARINARKWLEDNSLQLIYDKEYGATRKRKSDLRNERGWFGNFLADVMDNTTLVHMGDEYDRPNLDPNTTDVRKLASRQASDDAYAEEKDGQSMFYKVVTGVGGIAADPVTWMSGGVGSIAGKGVMSLGGRYIAGKGAAGLLGKGLSSAAIEAGTREFGTSLAGRIITGVAAGSANFATFEGSKAALMGGSLEDVAKETAHGAVMGAATGWISPVFGQWSNKLTEAATSTAGKLGTRTGMFGATVLTEGTIFSTPELYGILADDEGNKTDRMLDAWTESNAMMLGFKAQGLALHTAPRVVSQMWGKHANPRAGLETRFRQVLDGNPDLALTKDERKELDARGYGDLMELVRDKEITEDINKNRGSVETAVSRQGEGSPDLVTHLQEMLQDGNISEAARAKMYYLATGRLLPMSTVISGDIEKTEDGDFVVKSYGTNGVITSRSYKKQSEAESALSKIQRQTEFNFVLAGEHYQDYKVAPEQRLYDAAEAVMKENPEPYDIAGGYYRSYNSEELVRLYNIFKKLKPEERSEAEQSLVDAMDEALKNNKDKFGASSVRKAVDEEYNVDVNKSLAKEPNRRSEAEQKALTDYVRRLFPEDAFKAEDAATEGEPNPTEPINPNQPQLTQHPTGREPYERGRNAQPNERRDIVFDMQQRVDADAQEAYSGMVDRINEDADAEVQRLRADYEAMRHNDGTVRPATLKLDDKPIYIVDGNVQMMDDGTMVDLEKSDKTVVVLNPETGKREMISPEAIMLVKEPMGSEEIETIIEQNRADFIQRAVDEANGTLPLAPGDMVDLQTAEGKLVKGQIIANDGQGGCVVALQDGTQMNVEARELQRVADDIALADYKQRNGIVDETPVQQETAQPVTGQGAPTEYTADTELTIRDEDGQEKPAMVMGRVRLDNGQFVPDEQGAIVEYLMDGEVKHDHIDALNDKVVSFTAPERQRPTDTTPQETPAQPQQPVEQPTTQEPFHPIAEQPQAVDAPGNDTTTETTSSAPLTNEVSNEQVAENQQTQPQENAQTEAVPMPMTADEEPDYYAVEPSRAHSYIYNETGLTRSEANEHVMANYEQAQKDFTKANSAQMPKMGTSIKTFNEAKAKRQQKIDEAQKRMEYWQAVRDQQQQIVSAENAERAARDAEQHDAAVAQVAAEREAAKQAEAERKAVGNENPMPAITEKWNTAVKTDGTADEIVLPNGKTVSGHYVLHESGASSPSHQATSGFKQTDGFPMDVNDNTVNDRDYEHDVEAQRVTESIAQKYDQRALQTPVVVSKDGVVLSGNGRTMAGELAAKAGTDGAYIDYLKKYAGKYGFTPEQVDAMQHPRLSFVPDEDMPYTAETFSAFNQQEMKSLSKTEQSVKLGKTVPDDTFRKVLRSMNGFDTLGDFYNDANASFDAISMMSQAGVIPQAQMAEMMDGHKLSAVGREMLENMLIGKSFESNPEVVRMLTSVPSMRQSVIFALAEISNNIGLGEDFSLETELADAIKLCYEARTNGKYEHGERVSDYARQLKLFAFEDELQTVADINNATILMLADVLNDKRVSLLKKTLVSYNDEAKHSASGQLDLFAGGVRKKEEILKDVLTLINNGNKKDIEASQQSAVERRKAESVQQNGVVEPGNQGGDTTGGNNRIEEAEVRRLTFEEAKSFIADMEHNADVAQELPLTPENWSNEFGENGVVSTPIGDVKMGDNQYLKIAQQGRNGKLGMVKPTLTSPDAIVEESSEAKEGDTTERHSSYIFIKAFKKADGSRFYYFTSVTVSKDGKEVVISNQEKRRNAIANLLVNGNLVWKHADDVSAASDVAQGLYSSQGNLSDPTTEGTVAPQTNDTISGKLLYRFDGGAQTEQRPAVVSVTASPSELQGKGNEFVKTEPQQPNNAVSDGSSLSDNANIGNSSSEPNGKPTVSADKVTENGGNVQGNGKENAVEGGNTVQQKVEAAEAETNTEPTQAQIEAGNYKKGHVTIGDFDITIENPKGSERKGVDADGKQWSATMNNTYGYIRGAVGVDGDHIDVFLGDNMDEWNGRKIFVVDQTNTDGSFDEHKCMIGFNDEESALSAYLANYSADWKQTHPNLRITGTNVEDFKKWIDSSKRKTKAFAEYSNVKTDESTQLVEARTEGYSIEKRTDTRNGNDIFAVKFEERVSRDEFNGQKAIAKRFGGYWSNFGKKGFLFKSEEAAQDFAETVMGRSVEEVEDEAPITINDVAAVNDKNAEEDKGGAAAENAVTIKEKSLWYNPNTNVWAYIPVKSLGLVDVRFMMDFGKGDAKTMSEEEFLSSGFEPADNTSNLIGLKLRDDVDRAARRRRYSNLRYDLRQEAERRAEQQQQAEPIAAETKPGDHVVLKDGTEGDVMLRQNATGEQAAYTLTDGRKITADDIVKPGDEKPQQEQTKQEEEPKTKSKFVNDEDADRFEELRKRLHQKLYGQLNSGFDPETFAIGAEMAYLMLKKGARKMNEFAKSMVELMGDAVRPHIKSFYDGARHMMSEEIQREMSSHEEVDTFDALNFDKQGAKDIIATAEHIANERKSMEIATEAEQQIKDKRNEEKRNKEKQIAADTETVVNEAEASASEVESKLETATTEEDANDLGRQVDEQLERVNEQLAILGYYEAEEVEKDWNEAYGYMRNAEKKAVKDATALAERLVKDLGLNLEEQTRPEKGKTKRKLAVANIAPAGGEIAIRLHLNDKKDLYIYIPVMRDDYASDNLHTGDIMFRYEDVSGNGNRYGENHFADFNTTYDNLLSGIKGVVKKWLPQEDYVAMAQRIAEEAEQPVAKEKKKKASKKSSQAEMPTFFDDLFAELDNQPKIPTSNEKVQLQPRPGKAEREGGHEPRQNEPLGKGEQHEAERPDGRGVDRRGAGNTEPDAERGGAVSNPVAEQPVAPFTPKNTRNNHAERGVDYAPKGENARIEANIKAIETMLRLIESGEEATPEDMEVLRKFSGWGGLGKAFNEKEKDKWGYQAPNPINKRLRELLSSEQYDAANLSRNSAYYTPAEVIDTMWDIARALGFKGGRVLEGSAGIGNIIGLMPQDMSERSDIQAVEIDETTGNILKLLYPDAKVEVKGFEMTNVANGSVDLAITNVPFVTGLRVIDKTGDKDLSTKFGNIHDFCIAKNVRKLREGGIGIFITSSGTLDNSQKLRNWLVNEGKSDVVGAFRMHNKTFGGTGATSDIIVVRKRVNGMKSANAIDVSSIGVLRTTEYTDTRNGGRAKPKQLALDFNNYFIEHPEFMAGEMRFCFEEGDTYHPTSKSLYPRSDKEQSKMLREWADGLSKMNWEKEKPTAKTTDAVTYEDLGNATDEPVSEGSMFLNKKGELCIAQRGVAVPLAVNANKVKEHTKAECFNAYKSIKDALTKVLEYQTNNDDDAGLQPLIKKLNSVYDAFVNTYGHLNKNRSIPFLRKDIDYPSIAALEGFSETGDKKGKRVQTFWKTDIFTRRVVEKESEPKPTTVKDGIIASIYLNGRVDVPYIAGQLGISEEDVRRQIVESGLGFENPTTTDMEVSYEYLSGNVREKLAQAIANNADGRYDANVKALERVVPMDIPAHLIEFTLGSSWIEPKLYEDYVKERTALENVRLHNVGGTWIMNEPYYYATEQNKAMGVRSEMLNKLVYGHELIAAALQNRTIQVSKTEKKYDGSTETITDKEATQACANKIDEIRQDFKDWARAKMQEDTELAQKIERLYNEQFNNYVPKSIPDEFVPEHFGGAARVVNGRPFQLRPHQAKAAIRATTQPLMLAHEVGTGKTYTLITTAMEMRRLGTARKPMIVVQNATVGQFVASAKSLYPNAKILTLEDADKNKEGRMNFYAKIRYNDWDMIVVPQSVFDMIPDSEERQAKFVEDKIEEKMRVLEQMREAAGNDTRNPNVRQAERELEKLYDELNDKRNAQHEKVKDEKREAKTRHNAEVKALEMLDRAVDDVADFDEMGIDALLIDEAHEYKHLGFTTAMQRGVKGVDPSYSKRSEGLYLKTRAVLENNNGKNIVFATGTPISNTAAEIWTFMRYLMPADMMKEYEIFYFDDFVRNFGNIQNVLEFGPSGKYKPVNRFLGYFNLPELVRVWAGVTDTVLTREAGGVKDKIPDMEGEKAKDVYLPQTRALRGVMKYVKKQLEEFEKMSGRQKKENSHIPLTMYGIAKAAAVDARLVQDDAADETNNKTNETVRQTLSSLKETADYKGTVAIFSDNYQNKRSGFNLYNDIRDKLIAAGVPEEQVVVMRPGMTVKKKLEIFDKVNSGEVRVIMGSTATLGTGVNIQERLHTLIHIDAPVRPMDYTQRNGRILRQGNLHRDWNKPVRVLRFGVEDSLDVTAYQRLKTKGAIADSIMEGKKMISNSMENRALEEEQDVFGDITAQLSGSQYALLKNQMEKEVKKLQAKRKQWEADQTYIHNQKPNLKTQIQGAEEWKAKNEEALNKLNAAGLGEKMADNGSPAIKIGQSQFSGLDAMGDFIKDFNKKQNEIKEQIRNSASVDEKQTRKLTISVGGFDFVLTSDISKELKNNQGTLFASAITEMTYSCPELNLENVKVKGQLLRSALEDIMQNIITGADFSDKVGRAERLAERYRNELAQIEKREGVPFQFDKELAEAEDKLEEYDALMQKELEEKEAKYAEMDKDVEAATDVQLSEEDDDADSEDSASYRIVDDPTLINDLEDGEWEEVYRVMQVIDGELYPPMAAVVDGEMVNPIKLGVIEQAEEHPELIKFDENGKPYFNLNKGLGKGSLPAAYNPYWHTSRTALNDQFSSAYIRPNLVVVRTLVPKSELTSGYRAQYAKDAVGEISWHNGPVSGQLAELGKHRRVILSRYDKPMEIVPHAEVAKMIAEQLRGTDIAIPYNVVWPQLAEELEKLDVEISQEASGTVGEDADFGKAEYITDDMIAKMNAKAREGMVKTPEAKREVAERLGAKLNTRIRIVDDVNTIVHPDARIQAKRRRAKGWYDTKTGEIVVVVPNNRNVEDVMATVFHEIVGHKGLRELVGEENYGQFLMDIYTHAKADVRRRIDKLAAKNGWNFEKATDEYLAGLAEKGFEDFDEVEKSIWQKLKQKVLDAINKFLKSLKLPKWVKLGDNELRYMLWRSYENMQRGREDVIQQAQDIVKREELGLGDAARMRMGDAPETFETRQKRAVENKGTVMPGLNDAEVKMLDIPRHPYKGRWSEARAAAIADAVEKYTKEGKNEQGQNTRIPIPQQYDNYGVSFTYNISKNSIEESVNPKQTDKSVKQNASAGVHLAVLNHLDEIIGASIEVEEHPDYLKDEQNNRGPENGYNPDVLVHRFMGAIVIDGVPYRVKTTMLEYKDSNRDNREYAYDVTKIELLDNEPGSSVGLTGSASVDESKSNGLDKATFNDVGLYPTANLLRNVKKSYDNGEKLLENSKKVDGDAAMYRDDGETGDIWNDHSLGFDERMTAAATRLANNHAEDKRLKNDAWRAIGGNLANLRKAMSLQRQFDITTVKRVADLARILMDSGFLTGLNQMEVKRLIAAVKNSTGHENVEASVQRVLDIMVDNQLSHAKQTLHKLVTIKGSKVDAKGVEVQGQLDPDGARTMQVFKKTFTLSEEDINLRIAEASNRMSSTDTAVADEAAIEHTGLNLALEYVQNIASSVAEEKELRDDLKQHAEAASARDKATDSYRQYVQSIEDAIRKNKTERVEAYYQLAGRLTNSLRESIANAEAFREAEKQRVAEIHHNANSDMYGRPSNEHHKATWKEKFVNNSFVQLFFSPLATFDQMLRMFGSRSANGEGYLYNRFMRGWVDARQKEITGVKEKYSILDNKAAEVFANRKMKWGDLINMERKLPKATVTFWDGGEMREHELSQGNLLYIYMVNKMLDGRIKLRKMGITEEKVAVIESVLDPRFVELADWLQEEFLVDTRNEYNETHKRMFGASMAAIENYFPLKILANARADKPEDLDNPHVSEGISTTTGSIIKRRRNALALDLMNADAFHVILDHVAQMEHWNAYAEWNRDLNTLRTYRRFRNQVQNMTSVYGGGKELWKKFNDVCQMAAGTYRPPRSKLDEAAVNFAKGVTAAKVSFRVFTALKQLLSMPAFIAEARADHLLEDLSNPYGAWKWSMENLPIFKERWQSRKSGDPRLLKNDMDWKMWRSRIVEIASRVGMSPNAFVDALTISVGAHSMYKTRRSQYISDGYSEAEADRKAKQDAEVLYNQTQQSSEGAFTSTMQVDRSWLSVMFTVFRNASMSYTRQLYDAVRNMKRNLTPGQRAEAIAFMAKQMERDGIDADTAQKSAERKFNRHLLKDALRIGVFGYLMQFAWNLGAYLPYLLFGYDDDEKEKMWDDVWAHTAFGSIEGLTGGDVMSQAGGMLLTGEGNPAYLSKDMPLTSDIISILKKLSKDKNGALSDMVNLAVQSGVGVNPQSITDAVLSILDACGNDPAIAHEATICVMRILQVPQSQIDKMYFDEVGLSGEDVSKYTPAQLAERYAHYKVKRGRLYAPWSWNDEETTEKQTEKAETAIKERLGRLGNKDANTSYQELDEEYKEMRKQFTAFNKAKKDRNESEMKRIMNELQSDPAKYQSFMMFKKLDGVLDDLVGYYLKAKSAEEADVCKQSITDFKSGMVNAIKATDEAERASAMSGLTDLMNDFSMKYKDFRSAANQ